jgi:succinate dehydrogenase / fumarate reductase flavoprotein subunit
MGCNVTATWRAAKRGALFANPCYCQIHPTCIPQAGDYQSKLTLMSESLRNDGRVWVPKSAEVAAQVRAGKVKPADIAEADRDYYLERRYPTFGNLVPRDVASRAAKKECDEGKGVAMSEKGYGVFLDFAAAIERYGKIEANKRGVGADKASASQIQEWGAAVVEEKYGNLFEMYQRITGDSPYETPMRIYPAPHYIMGGLWVDYNLQSNVPGLFVIGEANFSDHGANRLGASALMQGLADGYFVLPYTIGHYLAQTTPGFTDNARAEFEASKNEVTARLDKILSIKGNKSCDEYHRELGYLMLDQVGMARDEAGLKDAIANIQRIRKDFWENVSVPGSANGINQSLEKAARVAEFLEFAEVMAFDALERAESCGGHFRLESQTEEGEAMRMDDQYSYVAAWQYNGEGQEPTCHKEGLSFQYVLPSQRSYK